MKVQVLYELQDDERDLQPESEADSEEFDNGMVDPSVVLEIEKEEKEDILAATEIAANQRPKQRNNDAAQLQAPGHRRVRQ